MPKFLVEQLRVPLGGNLQRELIKALGISQDELISFRVLKRSIDARKKEKIIYWVYNLEVEVKGKIYPVKSIKVKRPFKKSVFYIPKVDNVFFPIIVGMGPCGLFCALFLAEAGIKGIILERGCKVEERVKKVRKLWDSGILDEECNPAFGEGGAGTFSDGKLTTRVRHPFITWIFERLVEYEAPSEILVDTKPHVGTDNLRKVVRNIRDRLIHLGWDVRFNSKVTDLIMDKNRTVNGVVVNNSKELKGDCVILAMGNSARDTYEMLKFRNVVMEAKPFAVGYRIEHPQELINRAQYGKWYKHPDLPPAYYQLACTFKDLKRGVYTFCMCPGGYVICASSENGHLVTNGMSYHSRNSFWANSAVVVTVDERDYGKGVLEGINFQRQLERKAYFLGGGGFTTIAQRASDFIEKKESVSLPNVSYKPKVVAGNLWEVLPTHLCELIKRGLIEFDKKIKGFASSEGVLLAVETRTSSPVRITRDKDFQSVSHKGLYPCGEGAGYAGGIISSALDGIKVAQSLLTKLTDFPLKNARNLNNLNM